jgi:hypothetical protein
MIPVIVPVVVPNARSKVGRKGPIHRKAMLETIRAVASEPSSTDRVRSNRGRIQCVS